MTRWSRVSASAFLCGAVSHGFSRSLSSKTFLDVESRAARRLIFDSASAGTGTVSGRSASST
jgi:hypothetical protein